MCAKRVPLNSSPASQEIPGSMTKHQLMPTPASEVILDSMPDQETRKKAEELLKEYGERIKIDEDGSLIYPDGARGSSVRDLLLSLFRKGEKVPFDYYLFLALVNREEKSISITLPYDWKIYHE